MTTSSSSTKTTSSSSNMTTSSSSTTKYKFKIRNTPPKQEKVKFKFKVKSKAKAKPTLPSNDNDNDNDNDKQPPSRLYNPNMQYIDFVEFCSTHNLPYFQFYDVDNWKGPATKIEQDSLEYYLQLFDDAQHYLHTIVLNGYGFAIVKPIQKLDDSNIKYKDSYFEACKFTDEPIQPYNSDMDMDVDTDYDATTDEEIEIEEEFIAEEWQYDGVTYLLDTSTNYLYFPSTLQFIGKKTGDFSIDFNAKER